MAKLQCKVCGGKLNVNADGKSSECENCGAAYTQEVMKQMLGTPEDPVHVKVAGISDLEKLLDDADIAMKEAERSGTERAYAIAGKKYYQIFDKYPRNACAFVGSIKASSESFLAEKHALNYDDNSTRRHAKEMIEIRIKNLEETKKNPPVGITDPADIQKIKDLCDVYINKIRPLLEKYEPSYIGTSILIAGLVLGVFGALIEAGPFFGVGATLVLVLGFILKFIGF